MNVSHLLSSDYNQESFMNEVEENKEENPEQIDLDMELEEEKNENEHRPLGHEDSIQNELL